MSELTEFPKRTLVQVQITRHEVRGLRFRLSESEAAMTKAIDEMTSAGEVAYDHPELEKFFVIREGIEKKLRQAIQFGVELSFEMPHCRRLAESLRGGRGNPSPEQFIFDAVIELQKLEDRILADIKTDTKTLPEKKLTIDELMQLEMKTNDACWKWSKREWAIALGRSESGVFGAPTWKQLERYRLLRDAENERRPKDRRRGRRGT